MQNESDEKTALIQRLAAAGLELPPERADALLPGLRRLESTVQRLRSIDLDFGEPALTFDAQSRGGAVDSE